MSTTTKKQESLLKIGNVVKNKWKINGQLGKGAFGEAFSAVDSSTKEEVAIKVERLDSKKMVLRLEVICLKKLQDCPYVVRYIHSGRQDNYNYLVMEKLGDNLADIRKRMPKGVFSMATTIKLGVQMIDALEGTHNLGYIHRDVKPVNYFL
jgi:tau tubulin kinase